MLYNLFLASKVNLDLKSSSIYHFLAVPHLEVKAFVSLFSTFITRTVMHSLGLVYVCVLLPSGHSKLRFSVTYPFNTKLTYRRLIKVNDAYL